MLSRPGVRLATTFQRRSSSLPIRLIERIVERIRVNTAAPVLLSVTPRLGVAPWAGAQAAPHQAARRTIAGGAFRTLPFAGRASVSGPATPRGTTQLLDRVLARGWRALAASPGERFAVPSRRRLEAPAIARAEGAPLKRLFKRTRQESLPLQRAARTLHRLPRPSVETPLALPSAADRRPARPQAAAAAPVVASPGRDLDRLTEQVMQRIDRRMTAWRERTGRTR
jgi:hypothetical protein